MLFKLMEKVSSGTDVNSPADGRGRFGRISNLTMNILSLNQGIKNIVDSMSLFETADVALEE